MFSPDRLSLTRSELRHLLCQVLPFKGPFAAASVPKRTQAPVSKADSLPPPLLDRTSVTDAVCLSVTQGRVRNGTPIISKQLLGCFKRRAHQNKKKTKTKTSLPTGRGSVSALSVITHASVTDSKERCSGGTASDPHPYMPDLL